MPHFNYESQIERYVRDLFTEHTKANLVYHTLVHTEKVIERIAEIESHYLLKDEEKFILYTAGWFHDTGHLFVPADQHEQKSADLVREFVSCWDIDESIIALITRCILVTKFPGNPQSLPEKIICDADLFHLGTDEFIAADNLVKKEFELQHHFIPADWNEKTLSFLQAHHFYTAYCQNLLAEGKAKNIRYVMGLIGKN
jgi:predicted metal-dependent HD superfamily phosphohydrolase